MSDTTNDWTTRPITLREIKTFDPLPTVELLRITRNGNRAASIAICGRTLTLAEVSHLGKACLEVLTAPEAK